ncbi:MAG: restriction endonuclease [Actinobacteria bacterium]|nr:restriction endonuclease [Actinomycetota bacterium]
MYRTWRDGIEAQAEGRSHRMGQTSPVTVYSYTCADTVEERIAHVLEEKQRLFDLVVDEVTLDLDRLLTAEDLFGLFDLAPPSAARRRADVLRGPASFGDFTGREFEEYVAALLRGLGYAVEVTPYTRDGGVDLVARQTDEIGLEKVLYVQCKNHSTAVGVEVVRSLLGILPPEDTGARAVLVCPAGFSAEARRFAKGRGVRLIDESSLRELARRVTLSAHGA